ncbi:hypothetical protein BC829DRAFT_236254 [Chytridium lagenaria]|nr:hypothetical protein BC829DRAFT_236254 [Chytridium lagenaria]
MQNQLLPSASKTVAPFAAVPLKRKTQSSAPARPKEPKQIRRMEDTAGPSGTILIDGRPTPVAIQYGSRIEELEAVIREHLGTGKFFLVAAALREIEDARMYEPEKNIYIYASNKFAFNRRTTNTYLCSASVYASLAEDPKLPVPINISHIRSLHKFPPEIRRFIWAEVCRSGQPVTEEQVFSTTAKFVSGVSFTDLNSEIYTPKHIITLAKQVIGKESFDLDPATTAHANANHQNQLAVTFYDESVDGLSKPWFGDIWLSPPYGINPAGSSKQAKWFFHAEDQFFAKTIRSACILLKVDLGQSWFVRVLNYPHCFFHHKIIFSTPTGREKVFPDDAHMLVYMGPHVELFCEKFKNLGSIPGVNTWCQGLSKEASTACEHNNLQFSLADLQNSYFSPNASNLRQYGIKPVLPSVNVTPSAEYVTALLASKKCGGTADAQQTPVESVNQDGQKRRLAVSSLLSTSNAGANQIGQQKTPSFTSLLAFKSSGVNQAAQRQTPYATALLASNNAVASQSGKQLLLTSQHAAAGPAGQQQTPYIAALLASHNSAASQSGHQQIPNVTSLLASQSVAEHQAGQQQTSHVASLRANHAAQQQTPNATSIFALQSAATNQARQQQTANVTSLLASQSQQQTPNTVSPVTPQNADAPQAVQEQRQEELVDDYENISMAVDIPSPNRDQVNSVNDILPKGIVAPPPSTIADLLAVLQPLVPQFQQTQTLQPSKPNPSAQAAHQSSKPTPSARIAQPVAKPAVRSTPKPTANVASLLQAASSPWESIIDPKPTPHAQGRMEELAAAAMNLCELGGKRWKTNNAPEPTSSSRAPAKSLALPPTQAELLAASATAPKPAPILAKPQTPISFGLEDLIGRSSVGSVASVAEGPKGPKRV